MKNKFFVSVDTRKSLVMKKALNYKLDLVNDISGLSYDKDTIEFLKKTLSKFLLKIVLPIHRTAAKITLTIVGFK